MRVLMLHNYYRQRGGEDIVFESEARLLRSRGHVVEQIEFRNDAISNRLSYPDRAKLAVNTVWAFSSQRRIRRAIRSFRPDIVHAHNTFPLISPAVFHTVRRAGIPIVHTLHNYRLLCPSAFLFRDGKICHDCLGRRFAWPGIQHECYQGSRARTATVAAMQSVHRYMGTWSEHVDVHIALTESARQIFVENGLDPGSVVVKPNFVEEDLGPGSHSGGNALFVGRLSAEKGVGTLLRAWSLVPAGVALKIAGEGPLSEHVDDAARNNKWIKAMGHVSQKQVLELMGDAAAVIFPSEWNETFGRTIIEAFSRGTPVIASDISATKELIQAGQTGLIFKAGDTEGLADAATKLLQNPARQERMHCAARRAYEQRFSPETNYQQLIDIYSMAIERSRIRRAS